MIVDSPLRLSIFYSPTNSKFNVYPALIFVFHVSQFLLLRFSIFQENSDDFDVVLI